MKRALLLILAAVPLFAFTVNFIYCDYDYYEDDYWYEEYWYDDCWRDDYWVYYPYGYYCIHYVWWYPWWWDWYWQRCHWCHNFYWDFFHQGFYIVWYDDGCWWFRPRYGRWVRYRLPYSYHEIKSRARDHGIYLPEKPPREISVPYNEKEIKRLVKQKDPNLYERVEKEHKSGNIEKMKKQYTESVKKEVAKKDQEYRIKTRQVEDKKSIDFDKGDSHISKKPIDKKDTKEQRIDYDNKKDNTQDRSVIIKKSPPNYGDKEISEKDKQSTKPQNKQQQDKEVRKPSDKQKSSTKYQKEKQQSDSRGREISRPQSSSQR